MKQLNSLLFLTTIAVALPNGTPPGSDASAQDFLHDTEIVTSPYLTFGDYGVHLGNFASPDIVSGDYVGYDQRWFEMLTSIGEPRLVQSLEQSVELDRFLFYASRSMANHIRALARLLIADSKRTEVRASLGDVINGRTTNHRKAISDEFIGRMKDFVAQAAAPNVILGHLKNITTVNGPFENALLERIWLQLGMVQFTNAEQYSEFLVHSLRVLEQFAKGRAVTVHLTPDHSKLLGTIINAHCLRSAKETHSTKFFFSSMSRDRKDLFVNLLYFLNLAPGGLQCIQETVSDQQSELLLRVPADSFFPRVQYPAHPRLYLVHSPTYNTQRSTNIGMYTFSSSWDTDVLPGSAGRVIVGEHHDKPQKIKITLTTDGKMTVNAGFKAGIFILRENSKGELTLSTAEASPIKRKVPMWTAAFSDVRRGDVFGFWNADVEQLPSNFAELTDAAWTGTRREILLQVAASTRLNDFMHVILIESHPRPPKK